MSAPLDGWVERFPGVRLAVAGDFIADEFIYGDTSRISREAPVLILNFRSREIVPGGGGNAAMNAAALGGRVTAVGAPGTDASGEGLRAALAERGIGLDSFPAEGGRFTPTKTRIMAGGRNTSRQQVIRVDHEAQHPIAGALEERIVAALDGLSSESVDAVIISDYGLGVVTGAVREAAERLAQRVIVTVDSRYAADTFRGVAAITPNEEEAEALLGFWPDAERLDEAGAALLERSRARGVLLTRGSQGMTLFEAGGGRTDFPIFGSDEVADVTGAGDTVIAAFTLALAAGAPMPEAAGIANRAAGLVVMKRGTAVVERAELLAAVQEEAQ